MHNPCIHVKLFEDNEKISRECNESAGLIGSIRSEFVKKDVYPVLYLVIVNDLHPDTFQ